MMTVHLRMSSKFKNTPSQLTELLDIMNNKRLCHGYDYYSHSACFLKDSFNFSEKASFRH